MNINDFLKKHNFGEVEKNCLIGIIENSDNARILSEDIAETFGIQLSLTQVEAIRNSYYKEYSHG
jgi:hypothetical protein